MRKILNFGSLNIDHVYAVDHFVRPGETTAALGLELFPGGKGLNQSVALARAGGAVYHAGKVGSDGLWLIGFLQKAGVHTELIDRTGTFTGTAFIQVDRNGQNCILIHHGANGELTDGYIETALSGFGRGDLLVLQNEVNAIGKIMEAAAAQGMDIAFNPSPMDASVPSLPLGKVTCFLLNEVEGNALTGETEPRRILDRMLALYPNAGIVLTLGRAGVIYRDRERTVSHGIYRVPVVDTTAAGDTFTGFFLSRLVAGCSVEEALRLASVASSLAVSRKGAAVSIPALAQVEASSLQPAD